MASAFRPTQVARAASAPRTQPQVFAAGVQRDDPASARGFLRMTRASTQPSSNDVAVSIEHRPFGDSTLSLLSMPPGTLHIDADARLKNVDAEFRVSMCLSPVSIETDGRVMTLRRGDILMLDRSNRCTIIANQPTIWLSLLLPRDVITRRFGGVSRLPAIFLPRAGVMTSLFRKCLVVLWRTGASLPPAIAAEMAETKIDLLMDAVREALSAPQNAHNGGLETLMRISDVINTGLSDPEFDAAALAVRMDMSSKSLSRLFGDRTPTALIRQLRLAQARRLLRSGALAGLTVAEIARRVGFGNLAHFSTLYSQTYGAPPNVDRGG